MVGVLRSACMAAILAAVAGFSQTARAEYYMIYPEPVITQWIEYSSPKYHHKKHHHKTKTTKKHHVRHHVTKPRSHYEISVTYYWPVCPGCACATSPPVCYPNDEQLNTSAVTGSYVSYKYDKKRFDKKRRTDKVEPTFDQRTQDDDVMYNPDMNNQYNMY